MTGACLFALFHIVTIVWTLFASSGSGEGQAFLVMLLDLPLVALLQAIPGGGRILYSSTSAYILFFSVVGTLMYAAVGYGIGMLVRTVLARYAASAPLSMDFLAEAPGPSPWYLRSGRPQISGCTWRGAGESGQTAGVMVLSSGRDNVLLLDFDNYVMLVDPGTLLVWHQRAVEAGPTAPVRLRVFRLSDLRPLQGDLDELCGSMRRAGESLTVAATPLCDHSIPTTRAKALIRHEFPEPLLLCQELLILCHSSAVGDPADCDRSNLALLIARPKEGTYQLFPQDWFNSAGLDYTFQGVTRVARDPKTGQIHGEGFRIDPFVLDKTLRRIL